MISFHRLDIYKYNKYKLEIMRKVIQYDDFKLNENTYDDNERLNSSSGISATLRDQISKYEPKRNRIVDSLNGDIEEAIELIASMDEPLEIAKLYIDMKFTHPEWELSKEIIDNAKGNNLENKIVELANLVIAKVKG